MDTYPTKILALSRTQRVQFVDKSQVFSLLDKQAKKNDTEEDSRVKINSRSSRSMFDSGVETPRMSSVNQNTLTSGFSLTRKLGQSGRSLLQ